MTAPVMTTPAAMVPLGATRSPEHIYGWNDGREVRYPIPNVTGIVGLLDKSGPLVGWAKREVAACAIRNLDMLKTMRDQGGPDSAAAWLKSLPDYQRDRAADLGSSIHRLAEAIVRGQSPMVTPEEGPYVASYRAWLALWQPRFLAAEEMVVSLKYDYAGTLDAIAVIDGETWCLDIKTGTGLYPETALQLAAYGFAEFVGRPGSPKKYRIPRATRYGVIHVRPEGTRLIPFMEKPGQPQAAFAAFLNARKAWGWRQMQSKEVIGKAIEREGAAA